MRYSKRKRTYKELGISNKLPIVENHDQWLGEQTQQKQGHRHVVLVGSSEGQWVNRGRELWKQPGKRMCVQAPPSQSA